MKPVERITSLESDKPNGVGCLREMGRLATSPITRNRFPVVKQIESASFPPEFKWLPNGGLKGFLKEPGAEKFSFLICDNGKNGRPVGYCAASYGVREDGWVDRSTVLVEAFAITPESQKSGMGMLGFLELLRRIDDEDKIDTIEFLLRDSTSYPAIMGSEELLLEFGWRVTDLSLETEELNECYGLDEMTGLFQAEFEPVHHVVLDKVTYA